MSFPVEQPFAYYATLSVAMIACLYLFISLTGELAKIRRRFERRMEESQVETSRIAGRVDALGVRFNESEERLLGLEHTTAGLAAVRRVQAMGPGIDANQRSQVMRMARLGARAEEIAADLHLPQNEVDLLVKVQRAVARAG